MTERSVLCDRCGQVIADETVYRGTPFTFRLKVRTITKFYCFPRGNGFYMERDLCPGCKNSFLEWYMKYGNKLENRKVERRRMDENDQ